MQLFIMFLWWETHSEPKLVHDFDSGPLGISELVEQAHQKILPEEGEPILKERGNLKSVTW